MTENNGYLKGQEVGALKADVANLKNDVNSIMTNHLPHIQSELVAIKLLIARWVGGVGAIVAIIEYLLRR